MDEPFTVLITGAGRGLGLAFAQAYAQTGWHVIATHRPGGEIDALRALADGNSSVELFPLDVCDPAGIRALAASLHGRPIDLLVNNAGVNGPCVVNGDAQGQEFGTMDYDAWLDVFAANTLGPVRVTEALIDNVGASRRKTVVVISSALGSIARSKGGKLAYRSSKAAINMVFKTLAVDLAPRSITVACFCPGWVQTRMGGPDALLASDDAVARVRAAIDVLTFAQSGSFWDENRETIAW